MSTRCLLPFIVWWSSTKLGLLVDELRKQKDNPRVCERLVEDWAQAMQGYVEMVDEELLLDLLAMSVCGQEVTLTTNFRGYSLVGLVQKPSSSVALFLRRPSVSFHSYPCCDFKSGGANLQSSTVCCGAA